MQRITAKASPEKLIISQTAASNVADAVPSLVIALVLFFCVTLPISLQIGHNIWLAVFYFAPPLWFLGLAAVSLARIVFPARTIIDKQSGDLLLSGRYSGRMSDLSALRLVFTGRYSPSRYALVADLASGESVTLGTTGYFGSLEELRQLGNLIADFTGRIDLYAH